MTSISVIVTTYKRPDSLLQCVKSILDQSHMPNKLIVISDGYDSEVEKLINGIQSKNVLVVYTYSENHQGRPAPLRNMGIDLAETDLIAFCDDDDIWDVNKLQKQVLALESHNADLCITNSSLILPNGALIRMKLFAYNSTFLSFQSFLINSNIILSSVLIKKSVLNNHNFEQDEVYRGWEDFKLWVDLYLSYPKLLVVVVDQSLVSYRTSLDSIRKDNIINKFRNIKIDISKSLLKKGLYVEYTFFSLIMYLRIISEILRIRKYLSSVKS